MTLKLFKERTLSEKITITQRDGIYLVTRSIDHYQVKLYALDRMFIELWYTRQWFRKKAVRVESGTTADGFMQPYLNMIQVKY